MSQMDVCPLLNHIHSNQLIYLTGEQILGYLYQLIPIWYYKDIREGKEDFYQWSIQLSTLLSVESNKKFLGKTIRTEKTSSDLGLWRPR